MIDSAQVEWVQQAARHNTRVRKDSFQQFIGLLRPPHAWNEPVEISRYNKWAKSGGAFKHWLKHTQKTAMLRPRRNFIRRRNIWAHMPGNANSEAKHVAPSNLCPAKDCAAIFLQMLR